MLTLLSAGELPVFSFDVNVARSWIQFVAEIAAVVVIILALRKRSDERQARRFEELLDAKTKPIQPGYRNGGESLGDIAADLRTVKQEQQRTSRVVLDLRERVVNLSDRVDENRDTAATGLAELHRVVDANAETVRELGLAWQRHSDADPQGGADLG